MAKQIQENTVVFGLHLGNSSACIASFRDGKVQVIANDVGDRITPAFLAVNESEKIVGASAKAGIARNNASTVINNKTLLNDSLTDEELEDIKNKTPYKIIKEGNSIKYGLKQGERTFHITAESVAVCLLTKLFEIASSSGKFDGDVRAVMCVPLHYPQTSRVTLMRAAEEAGFEVLQVIAEVAATAMAYNIGVQNPEDDMFCLAYRVGGVSLDVHVLEISAGMYSVVESVHVPYLGGNRFTKLLADFLAEEYRKKCKLDPLESRRSMAKLTSAAETCKHVLSTMSTAHCFVESLCEGVDFSYNITRARFESLISPIISQYTNPIKDVLQKANMDENSIKKILLCGGSVKVPKVQQAVQDMFPNAEIVNGLSPDEAIAIGAARHGSYLSEAMDLECLHLSREIPAISLPIYIRGPGIVDKECIIPGLTPVSVKRTKKFKITQDDVVNYELLEINPQAPDNCLVLGILSLEPVSHPTEVKLEVTLNRAGGLTAVLCDIGNQRKSTLKLDPPQ